jgi:Tfp pilus assembly protein PilN
MADIDMIPRSYHDSVRARRALRSYGMALSALLLAGALAAGLLHWRLAVQTPQLEQLRSRTAEAEALRTRFAASAARQGALEQDAAALVALRGAGGIARMAEALDMALNDKVWFDSLRFTRTEELLRAPLPSPLPAGTLVTRAATPSAAQPNAAPGPQTWRLARHVDVQGQALDHAALATFLATLSANPVLGDVRFLKSTATAGEGPEFVAFSVTASLGAAPAAPGGTP